MTDTTIKRKDQTALPKAAEAATATTVRPRTGGFLMPNGQPLTPEVSFFAGRKVIWPIRHEHLAGAREPWSAPRTDHVALRQNATRNVDELRRRERAAQLNAQAIDEVVNQLRPSEPGSTCGSLPMDLGMRSTLQ